MKVFVVFPDHGEYFGSGYGAPEAVFASLPQAVAYIDEKADADPDYVAVWQSFDLVEKAAEEDSSGFALNTHGPCLQTPSSTLSLQGRIWWSWFRQVAFLR